MLEKRYRDYPSYFKSLFSERVQKLSIDGGFSCPNRDGSKSTGGCTFCNNESFSPDYCRRVAGITQQIEAGIQFFDHKYQGQKYLAYFQNYSNTYAPLYMLRKRYEEALAHPKIVGIVVGTRPDCVSPEILDYLAQLAQSHYVCVEYGVESCDDAILASINRGHTYADAEAAIQATAERGLTIGAHLIMGLPGESRDAMIAGAIRLSRLPIQILKLHQLQIIANTAMAADFEGHPEHFQLFSLTEYINLITDIIARVNPNIYFERFVNQAPSEYLIAPSWGIKNFEFAAKLDKRLTERNIRQGILYLK